MINKIIAVYSIIDDILKATGHREDCRRTMSDAEILTTGMAAGQTHLKLTQLKLTIEQIYVSRPKTFVS